MDIHLDKSSLVPLGEQLQTSLKVLIRQRALNPDDTLPTVKELAASLKLNYNTVAAAYRALEREGYVVQNRRAGTRVAPEPPADPKQALVLDLIARLSRQLAGLELDTNDLLKLLVAQRSGRSEQQPYRLAVLAGTPLEALQAAERAQALLGENVTCVPETLHTYTSRTYHLTVIDPKLVPIRTATTNVIPTDTLVYSHAFPAGAD